MRNILTREEIVEQFGYLLLEFDFFCGNTFTFSGEDKLGYHVSLFVKAPNMSFVGAKSSTSIRSALQQTKDCRFLIMNKDLEIIYED